MARQNRPVRPGTSMIAVLRTLDHLGDLDLYHLAVNASPQTTRRAAVYRAIRTCRDRGLIADTAYSRTAVYTLTDAGRTLLATHLPE